MPEAAVSMSKADFVERTKLLGRSRSPQLQAIDRLLGEYETSRHVGMGGDLTALRRALHTWKMKEGIGWRSSARNAKGAIEELEFQLAGGNAPTTTLGKDAAHARVGLLYLFANTTADANKWKFVAESGLDLMSNTLSIDPVKDRMDKRLGGALGGGVSGAKLIVPSLLEKGAKGEEALLKKGDEKVRTLWQEIKKYLTDLARKIFDLVVGKVKQTMLNMQRRFAGNAASKAYAAFDLLWGPVSSLVDTIVGKVAAKAAPFVSGAISTITGIKSLCESIYQRYQSYAGGKDVNLSEGHPVVIAKAINRAMNINIGKGLYQTLKGGASVAMAAASFGASAIVDLVIAGAEAIIGFIHRTVEIAQINAFCADCKERYAAHKEPSGIHNAPRIFGAWFNATAMSAPAVAALALTSGITGDKMQYMQMFSAEGDVITQSSFDRGVKYLDELKSWSHPYLADTGYSFLSNDPLVKGRLAEATNTDFKPLTVLNGWQKGHVNKPDSKLDRIASVFRPKAPVGLPPQVTIGRSRPA